MMAMAVWVGQVAAAEPVCSPGDEAALRWLDRMSHSLRETSYKGVFTYQHGNSMQAMRITHSVKGNVEREEVTGLTGSGARVVRTEHPLDCVHPGHKLVRIGRNFSDAGGGCGLAAYYGLKMGGVKRVAGRKAIIVNVRPRDMYRYGYQMALDTETGLLLKTQTLAQDGKVLERFQFADLEIGDVELEGTQVDVIHHAAHSHGENLSLLDDADTESWKVNWVPEGFTLTDGTGDSGRDKTFTDGLATFSVFLEPAPGLTEIGSGRARQGGTTAYTTGMIISGRPALVTVLGEVPINTARMVADSVNWVDINAD
jgi:sigma-E factor negative regulatory protein RseB